ncbi:DNA repair protein RAD51 homolog 3 [Athalia rosae]|uniref:DNA repair protein RAD51 homolog 3 n=1 Tax=Athalia rosae TaxID=37344 RepID=UPI0020332806|nr:DNA repair protein RAD51 homolog 3 [Athalia rosae]
MLQSIHTLPLSEIVTSQLKANGFCYVEDIRQSTELPISSSDKIQEVQILSNVPRCISALDILQEELQRDKISTLSYELDNILGGGFQCGTITELCGAPGSGKTQICLQLCITVQMSRIRKGLGAEALYMDTRNGVLGARLREMAMGCQAYFEDEVFDVKKILERITVASPQSFDEIVAVLDNFEYLIKNRQVRLVVLDSLSFLRHSLESAFNCTQICFQILDTLYKLSTKHNLVVVITNELITKFNGERDTDLYPAGGTFCAHRIHTRLMLTCLNNNQFSSEAIKASMVPQISKKFQVTTEGVRDIIMEKIGT